MRERHDRLQLRLRLFNDKAQTCKQKKENQLINVALDLRVENSHILLIILFLVMWKMNTLDMMETFTRIMMLTLNMTVKFMMDMETLNMTNSDIYKEIIGKCQVFFLSTSRQD